MAISINIVEDAAVRWDFEDDPEVWAMVRPASPQRERYAADAIEFRAVGDEVKFSLGSGYTSIAAIARACLDGEVAGISCKSEDGTETIDAPWETIVNHCPAVVGAIAEFARATYAELTDAEKNLPRLPSGSTQE